MKKYLLFVIVFSISCGHLDDSQPYTLTSDGIRDSVLFYYKTSLAPNLSLEEKKQAISQSLFFSRNITKDTLYNLILYQKNSLHYALQEYDSLEIYNDSLINYASRINDRLMLAYQHYLMGHYFSQIAHDPERAFRHYTLSKGYYEQIGDSSWVGRNLLNMGTIQKDFDDFFGSKETLTEALQFLAAENDTTYMAQCYNLLATDHRKLLNYEDAVAYYKRAINLTKSEEDRLIYKNNLAATYIDDALYEEAITVLERIANDPAIVQNSYEYARVLDNLAYARWLSGKEKEAVPFLHALKIRSQNNDKRGQIASYTHLGEFHSKDRPQTARAYFDTVIGLSKTIKMPRAEKDALKFLVSLEPNSAALYKRYVFLQDSLYRQEHKVKTQFAKYKYDDRQKQESIFRLEKENTERELETAKQRNYKTTFLLGFIITGLVGAFVFYVFKQRNRRLAQENKTAKLEATLETEAEMSRRLHDDFGAGLNQAMLMVQGNTDRSTVLDTLDGLYNQSRSFSREINEVDTGPQFKEEFLEMLRYRTPATAKLLISGSKDMDWTNIHPLSKKVLYKIVQELMINVGRHSAATLITIAFEEEGKILKVDYTDNGVGASQQDLSAKNGLKNTEKRIHAIGGTITFDSRKGDGFKANIVIPK